MNISIIIATYNRPQLLKKCLQSIQAQSFQDFETIIVDDGSSSDTGQAIETFIRDPRFKYIRLEKNSGQTMARNRGIDRAEGDYIMIWDDDDTLDANALQILSEAVRERPDALLISCGARLQHDNGTIRDVERRPTGFFGYDEIISGQIPDNEVVILVKRSELGSNRFRAKNIDFLFYHQLMSRGSWYHLDIDVGTIIITEQWSTLTQQRKIPNAQLSMERAPFLDEYLKKNRDILIKNNPIRFKSFAYGVANGYILSAHYAEARNYLRDILTIDQAKKYRLLLWLSYCYRADIVLKLFFRLFRSIKLAK